MSAMEKRTKQAIEELQVGVRSMAVDMRFFSLSMRSLYNEKAVGTDEEVAKDFKELRDDIRNDAIVYIKGILPLATRLVTSISEYLDYFDALDFDEWHGKIPTIRREAAEYKRLCETLLKLHDQFLAPLKKRRDKAVILVRKMKNLAAEFEKKKAELKNKADTQRVWATALCLLPTVGPIAGSILSACGDKDLAEAVAAGERATIQEAAALVVKETLIPAFEAFIRGISHAAGFFSVMEHQLQKFEKNAKKSEDDPQVMFFKIMKVGVRDMKPVCQKFFEALPDIKSDFEALPTEGTDGNYVDNMLEKQKKIIEEECKGELAPRMLSAIEPASRKQYESAVDKKSQGF